MITHKYLAGKIAMVNKLHGRPVVHFQVDENGDMITRNHCAVGAIGNLHLNIVTIAGKRRYQVAVITDENFSQQIINEHRAAMTASECDAFLSGLITRLQFMGGSHES